jgi:AAA15 family ATPase/GTPase
MLKRIEIKRYKSLVDVAVDLKPLVVLLGPNAAGKSNFLDALQLLSRMAVSPTLKAAFEPPYRGKPLESFFSTTRFNAKLCRWLGWEFKVS